MSYISNIGGKFIVTAKGNINDFAQEDIVMGVDLDADGNSTKWKVENSWGKDAGQKGYFVASDEWMDEYTYQIVVRKDLLSEEELAAYEAKPQVLLPWDPMGALA